MYLWMVLAAFLATLAAYILPLRNDMDKVVDNPIAEAMMMKFKVKHYTIEQMMIDYSCNGTQKNNFMPDPAEKCENRAFYQATNDYDTFLDENGVSIAYASYAPFGFQDRLDSNYKSQIRCFCAVTNDDGTVSYNDADCTYTNDDCSEGVVKHGVLTIGKVPQHWLMNSPNGLTPSNDLVTALRKNFSGGIAVGILVEQQEGQYSIQNYSKTESATSRIYNIPNGFDFSECTGEVCFGYFSWK